MDRDTVIEPVTRHIQRLRHLWFGGNGYPLTGLNALVYFGSRGEPGLLLTVIVLRGALKRSLRGGEALLRSIRLGADVERCHRLVPVALIVDRITRRRNLLDHPTTLQNLHGARYRLVEDLPTRFILVGDRPEVDLGDTWGDNTGLIGEQIDGGRGEGRETTGKGARNRRIDTVNEGTLTFGNLGLGQATRCSQAERQGQREQDSAQQA